VPEIELGIIIIIIIIIQLINKKHLKNLGPFATASRRTPHYHSQGVASVASHAARTPMSTTTTTTTTTTTRDRGDRYGPIEWAQQTLKNIKFARW